MRLSAKTIEEKTGGRYPSWSRDGRGMVAGMDRKWTVNEP